MHCDWRAGAGRSVEVDHRVLAVCGPVFSLLDLGKCQSNKARTALESTGHRIHTRQHPTSCGSPSLAFTILFLSVQIPIM